MAFKFSLETVLRVRESIEQREEAALQRILAEMASVRRRIEELQERIRVLRQAKEDEMRQATEAFRLRSMAAEADAAAAERTALELKLADLEKRRLEQMSAYQNAHRNRQMLADMKSAQREEWDESRARAQQKFLDDIFAARSHRT